MIPTQVAERPLPLPEPTIDIKVLTDDTWKQGDLYIGLDWQNYINLAEYLEQVKSKFEEYSNTLDYYESFSNKKAPD